MITNNILESLNDHQREAVSKPRQPVLLLAGPGTGKTRTLIARIVYEIQNYHIPPEQILALTFSNKAANEIRQRLFQELPEKAEKIRCGTFHSFCLDVLRKNTEPAGLQKHFSICDDTYQVRLLTRLLKDRVRENPEKKVRGMLLNFSNHLLKNKPLPAFSAMIYEEYSGHLLRHNLLDFNQLLFKTRELFKKNADILEQYRFLNESILVDEFQDTDAVQYEIVKLLAEKHRNIFAAADDDQSIYAWRGAQPENIRSYMRDFSIDRPVFLEKNYRSGKSIVEAARAVVATTDRIEPDKIIEGSSEIASKLKAVFFSDESREIQFIIKKIIDWQHNGNVGLEDIAVIYPRHLFAEKLIPYLLRKKIPFQQAGGKNLIDHPSMKIILLYLKLLHDPADPLILEDLLQAELGYHVFKQIQDIQHIKKIDFRKALNEIVGREEVSYTVRNQISTFIGNTANLINLKTFFSFDRLIQEIIRGMQNLKPSVLEHNASKLKETPFKQCTRLKKISTKIWLYHSDAKISFIAEKLLQRVFGPRIYLLDKEKIIHVSKNDFVVLLEALETDSLPCPYELIFHETNERRRGIISTLFRWLQVQLKSGGQLFKDYVVFDLETTGKNPDICGIVEIAAVRVRDGKITEEYQTLVNPGIPIEKEAQQVHHISEADIKSAPKMEEVWPSFTEFAGDDLLIAHNGYGFDFKVMDRVSRELSVPKLQNVRYDSLILARNMFPGKQNSIDALAARYKLDTGTRHRALDDVRVLHEIFQKLLQVKEIRSVKVSAGEFSEYAALANVVENTLSAVEDKVFFLAGQARLQSPYSAIRRQYTEHFSIDDQELLENLGRITGRMASSNADYSSKEDFFQRVLAAAREFNKMTIDEAVSEFLSYIALINPQDSLEKIDAVSLLTFHAAKGLEYEKVVIMGLEDGNMPSFFASKSDENDDRPIHKKMEEQKRLLYVGITRGKSEVVFTVVKNRSGRQQHSSPFLGEIKDRIDIAEAFE